MDPLAPLLSSLAPIGLDVVGVAAAADWDAAATPARRTAALLPGARSILVIGNGGRTLWDALVADLTRDPRGLADEANPLDAFVRRTVLAADTQLGAVRRRWFWASPDTDVHVDFRLLAGLAGLGVQSRLGLLIHPEWGMWMGLRAACFLDLELPASPAATVDPCEGCPAPCVEACPGGAFPGGRWDVGRCSAFHGESDRCARSCDARTACPVGADRRYAPEQLAYHYHRESGRRWLRGKVGLDPAADHHEGVGPHWGGWKVDVKGGGA